MPFSRLVLIAWLCLVALAPPSLSQQADNGPSGTITTETDRTADARTAVRIRDILQEIGGYEDITVTVSEGVVTLRGTTESATEVASLVALVSRIEGVVTIKNEVTETTDLRRRLDPAVNRFMGRVYQTVAMAPILLIAVGSLAVLSFTGHLVARMRWPWDRMAPNAFVADLYRQVVWLGFTMIGVVVALDVMNASQLLSTILGAAGLVGLAIGFAVRDTVENYIASIFLSIRQPFRPNDLVDIEGAEGKVIRLTSRATILLSLDGNHIRIPNATVFKAKIVNYTENRERRFLFRVKVSAANDLHMTRLLATRVVQELPFVLKEPVAQVWIDTIADGAVEIVVTGWIDQTRTSILLAKGEAMRQVKLAFEEKHITLPDATMAVHLTGPIPGAMPGSIPGATPRPIPRPIPGPILGPIPAPDAGPLPHIVPDATPAATPEMRPAGDATRGPMPGPMPGPVNTRPAETHDVEEVAAVNEVLLDQMIATERHDDTKQDLLTDRARKE